MHNGEAVGEADAPCQGGVQAAAPLLLTAKA